MKFAVTPVAVAVPGPANMLMAVFAVMPTAEAPPKIVVIVTFSGVVAVIPTAEAVPAEHEITTLAPVTAVIPTAVAPPALVWMVVATFAVTPVAAATPVPVAIV